MNDFASCPSIMNCVGKLVNTERALRNKETLAYYFASSSCPGQKELLQKLKDIYREVKDRRIPMEIIYISSDRDADVMLKHFRHHHHGWYALPVNAPIIGELHIQYNVTYEPQIIVVTKEGVIVTKTGMAELEEFGKNVIVKWMTSNIEY
ncbi:hypothetical protein Trydic_g2949 [Trypoxylus dichotomus]